MRDVFCALYVNPKTSVDNPYSIAGEHKQGSFLVIDEGTCADCYGTWPVDDAGGEGFLEDNIDVFPDL